MRTWVPLVGVIAATAAAAAIVAGPGPSGGDPLDPASTAPAGAKAVVETLRMLGADVTVRPGAPDASRTTTLLLDDALSDRDRDATAAWVRRGGTLVLADPYSPLSPVRPGGVRPPGSIAPAPERACAIDALVDVRGLDPGAIARLEAPPGATACFVAGGRAGVVVVARGAGTIVVVGGPEPFLNDRLAGADNAVLAAALLAPAPGARVLVVAPPGPGEGTKTLADLVPPRVELALLQLGVAFAVLVLWRARRLGRPVLEPQPVELAGSELVAAVGHLMQRAKGREQAAATLRDDLRRTLAGRLGLDPAAPAAEVADAAAAWSGVPSGRVRGALEGGVPADEAALVALGQDVVALREEIVGGR